MDVNERNRLVETVVPWCAALVNRHVEDRQRRDDMLQTVLLRVIKGLPSYKPDRGALTTWTAAVAIRVLTRPTRRKELPTGELPARLVDPRQRLGEDVAGDAEQRDRVREVLGRLAADDADLLRRHVVEGVPLARCDQSVSRERVRQRYARALVRARRLLESPV